VLSEEDNTMSDPLLNITEASWDGRNPSELDYLKPNGFKFLVHNLPNVSFFCQSANIPDITLGTATVPTPLVDLHEPGDKLVFGELSLRFLIQENMDNYKEIYNWLIGLGFPESHEQYINYTGTQSYRFPNVNATNQRALGNFSDATLFILDSNNNPKIKIIFKDAYPISLGGIEFEISSGNTDYFVGVATFKYRQYVIETV
jgi:hypothetical protein